MERAAAFEGEAPFGLTLELMSRPTKTSLIVVFAIVVTMFTLIMYEAYVPGQTKEVFGSVVGLEQIANNSQPHIRRYAAVKLENGFTVQARLDGYVTLVPGDHAAFLEITTPYWVSNVIASTGT